MEKTASEGTGELGQLLQLMVRHHASDLHLKVGSPPMFRVEGAVRPLAGSPLHAGGIRALIDTVIPPRSREDFDLGVDVDFALSVSELGRFRFHLFRQRGEWSAAIRMVRTQIPTFESLHLPLGLMKRLASFSSGLVLVCGATGTGKSTTLAAVLGAINARRRCHIVTIEDPIEFVHRDDKAFINQREVGIDVEDFGAALRSVVRQDPDVIMVGELRDRETVEAALMAAETGHLVYASLHSSTVASTLARLIDMFPIDRSQALRNSLAFQLRAIVCQKILTSALTVPARVPCVEGLIVVPEARKAISEAQDAKLQSILRGGAELDMCDFNQALCDLVRKGAVTEESALAHSDNPRQLELRLRGVQVGEDTRILGGD